MFLSRNAYLGTMEWRTELHVAPVSEKITLGHRFLTMGSCFADEIGRRLASSKFPTLVNPFGTVYNPISLHHLLTSSLTGEAPSDRLVLERDDVFFHYQFHSSLAALSKNELLHQAQEKIQAVNSFLASADHVIITYGTAWVYRLMSSGEVVANCHKQPSSLFRKEMLTVDEIVNSFAKWHSLFQQHSPRAKVILTVSPVRHVKDTLELNAVSKSTLRLACQHITEKFSGVRYFPAYEIMLDDLRDYRFYKKDLIHPTEEATDYIWEKFCAAYADEQSSVFIKRWKQILADLQHRPFYPSSAAHQSFLRALKEKLKALPPTIDVQHELEHVEAQLLNTIA